MSAILTVADLAARGAAHGFGLRDAAPPAGLRRATQVHGNRVLVVDGAQPPGSPERLGEADALVCATPAVPIGVVTADCVPILLSAPEARAVAAVHAGWKGHACDVIGAAVRVVCEQAACAPSELLAAIGPHVGACCYEVDAPVLDPLREHFGPALDAALVRTRPGHARLDLARLSESLLARAGVGPAEVRRVTAACTCCDERFHSFRRDADRAGRMTHWIVARSGG